MGKYANNKAKWKTTELPLGKTRGLMTWREETWSWNELTKHESMKGSKKVDKWLENWSILSCSHVSGEEKDRGRNDPGILLFSTLAVESAKTTFTNTTERRKYPWIVETNEHIRITPFHICTVSWRKIDQWKRRNGEGNIVRFLQIVLCNEWDDFITAIAILSVKEYIRIIWIRRRDVEILFLEATAKSKMTAAVVIKVSLLWRAHYELETWVGRAHGGRKLYRGKYTWISDYSTEESTYLANSFQRWISVPRSLFWNLHNEPVRLKPNYRGIRKVVDDSLGIPSAVKVLACSRLMRSGEAYDEMDDRAQMGQEKYEFILFSGRQASVREKLLKRRPTEVE